MSGGELVRYARARIKRGLGRIWHAWTWHEGQGGWWALCGAAPVAGEPPVPALPHDAAGNHCGRCAAQQAAR